MTVVAKLTQHKVIHHRGGMRPGTPDPRTVRPPAAPADKGGVPVRRNSDGTHTSAKTRPERAA